MDNPFSTAVIEYMEHERLYPQNIARGTDYRLGLFYTQLVLILLCFADPIVPFLAGVKIPSLFLLYVYHLWLVYNGIKQNIQFKKNIKPADAALLCWEGELKSLYWNANYRINKKYVLATLSLLPFFIGFSLSPFSLGHWPLVVLAIIFYGSAKLNTVLIEERSNDFIDEAKFWYQTPEAAQWRYSKYRQLNAKLDNHLKYKVKNPLAFSS